jgi:hypothetical protein
MPPSLMTSDQTIVIDQELNLFRICIGAQRSQTVIGCQPRCSVKNRKSLA